MSKRLVDQRRPVYWALARFVSPFHRGQWESRFLPDAARVAIRLTHFQPELRFIYHHNAKAASTTTHRLLDTVLARYAATLSVSEAPNFRGLLSGPAYWKDILPVLHDPSVYRFTFVRHPVSRAVSTFNNFFVETQNAYTKRHRFTRRKSGLRLNDASTENFDRFLDFSEEVIAESPDLCDLHIRTQKRSLLLHDLHFSKIGRMERWAGDMTSIVHDLGLSKSFRATDLLVRENASISGIRMQRPTQTQVDRIRRIYAEDFEAFGYEVE